MTAARALLVWTLAASSCMAADQTFTISGSLIRHSNKRPIAHALIMITANEHPNQQLSLKTAEDGRFTFTGVPKGKYTLSGEYRGFSQDYKQDEAYSTGIVTGAGLDSEHIVFPMELPGSLSVRVLDEAGEAVRNADVMLFRREVEGGRAAVTQFGAGVSYANGIYRFSNLTPGAYFVGVQGRPWYAETGERGMTVIEGPREHNEQEVVFPETYYPNTSDPDQARGVAIREGENTRIEFNLRPVAALRVTISGPGFDHNPGSDTQQFDGANVMSIGPGGTLFPSNTSMSMMSEHLLILGVAPGRHIISISHRDGQGAPRTSTLQSSPIEMTSDYTLNTAEISEASLSGHLAMEGGSLPAHPLMLMMRGPNRFANMTRIEKDGSFKSDVPLGPGQYQPMLVNTNELYIKDVAAVGASFEAGLLRVRGANRIELTITAAKGLIKADGIATTGGQPTPGAMVLLVPDASNFAGEFPRDQSDSDGTFTLRGIAPGRYRLVAIDDGRELEYRDRTIMTRYLAKAPQLEFPAAANTPLSVEVQRRQP